MTTNARGFAGLNRWKGRGLIICAIAVISAIAGSLVSAHLRHSNDARPDNRVFELLIYHAAPDKGTALESIFRDASKTMAKHDIDVVGYWVPNEDPAWKDTFIYLVAFPSREDAKKKWKVLHDDPDFQPYIKSAAAIIQKDDKHFKVDEVYMRPTDFSAMK